MRRDLLADGPGDKVLSLWGADLSGQFLAWRAFGFSHQAEGHLVLCNPHLYSGTPFLGGFQSALLYPPNPNQNLDRSVSDAPAGQPSALRGQQFFLNTQVDGPLRCVDCRDCQLS